MTLIRSWELSKLSSSHEKLKLSSSHLSVRSLSFVAVFADPLTFPDASSRVTLMKGSLLPIRSTFRNPWQLRILPFTAAIYRNGRVLYFSPGAMRCNTQRQFVLG